MESSCFSNFLKITSCRIIENQGGESINPFIKSQFFRTSFYLISRYPIEIFSHSGIVFLFFIRISSRQRVRSYCRNSQSDRSFPTILTVKGWTSCFTKVEIYLGCSRASNWQNATVDRSQISFAVVKIRYKFQRVN